MNVQTSSSLKRRPHVELVQGKPRTNSLKVAEHFGKRHDNVLRDIKNLDCSKKFSLLNFEERDYIDERGKSQPLFEMTKDGFTILAMGFTGKEAMRWKEAYIDAFNRMERELYGRFPKENSELQKARQFIAELLGNGPLPAIEARQACLAAGLAGSTVTRAKKSLGVASKKSSGQGPWVWEISKAIMRENTSPCKNHDHHDRLEQPRGLQTENAANFCEGDHCDVNETSILEDIALVRFEADGTGRTWVDDLTGEIYDAGRLRVALEDLVPALNRRGLAVVKSEVVGAIRLAAYSFDPGHKGH